MDSLIRNKGWLGGLSGALVALSLPGFSAWPIGFVALVPLFYALEKKRSILGGFLFGLALFAIDLRWILTLTRFSAWVVPGFILLIAYLSLYSVAFSLLVRWRRRPAPDGCFVLSVVAWFTLLEIARSLGPLGMGFSALHLSLYRTPWLIQSAAFLGPWSITAMLVAANGFFYLALTRRSLRYAVVGLAAIGALALFALLPVPTEDDVPVRVSVVSSTVLQEVKLDSRNLSSLSDRYIALGQQAATEHPDLIVYPESILPAYILHSESLLERFRQLARDGGTHVLFGTGDVREREIFNAVALLSPDGDVAGVYDMMRPVPFGEYVPGRRIWESIGLGPLADSFLPVDLSRGTEPVLLDGIGTPICFESTFSSSSRAFALRGADLLVTVTNDAWFAGSSELVAHFAASIFRAVETRRWLIQSANGGISGIVDPRGAIHTSTREEGVVTGTVLRREASSWYTRWGDLPLLVILGIFALLGVTGCGRRTMRTGE